MPLYARLILSTCCLTVLVSGGTSDAQPERRLDGHQVVRVQIEDESQLDTLVALDGASIDFEIWSDGIGLGVIEVRVSPEQKHVLDASGLTYQVEIEDLQRRIDELFTATAGQGFFDVYRTYDEHVAFMNDLVATYPDLAEMFNAGLSIFGRPLWAIRITGPGDDKPGIMYHGGQHGNEVMGTCVVAYMAEFLLTRYDSDPDVRTLVDDVEWFLLPIMNPDGYEAGTRSNANGADLNRNWGGPGSNPNPFSQPETAAMRDFFLTHPHVRAHIDFHTHGYMIMWPWGYTPELCDDHWTFQEIAVGMAEHIFQVHGTSYDELGPINTTIYPVRGGSIDYTYGERGLWAMTFELGYSHYMPVSEIMPTCEEIAPTMMLLSEWVSDCNTNGISDSDDITIGTSEDCNENYTPDECEIQPDFDGDGLVNVCDDDIDGDGVPNAEDDCDFTPLGTPINAVGGPMSDTDGNCEVDLLDYWYFRRCQVLGGPDTPGSHPMCINMFDYQDDADIDLADFAGFMRAFTGAP